MARRLWAGVFFSAAFLLQYRLLTVPLYGYWGFSQVTGLECLWLLPLMALPALALPDALDRPSALFATVNYAILYAPTCVLLFHSTRTSIAPARLAAIAAGLALAAVVLGRASGAPAPSWRGPRFSREAVLAAAWILVGLTALAALGASRVHWVDLTQTSKARAAYSAEVGVLGPCFAYADAWASLALIPFLLAYSLRRGARAAAALLCCLCVLLFLLSGRKTDLLCPAAVLAVHFALKRGLAPAGLLACLGVLLLLPLGLGWAGLHRPAAVYANVLNFRVFAVPQVLVPQYDAYYASHGLTGFRHVNLVNRLFFHGAAFTQPYNAVAEFYYHAHFTADAMPYATDALAAVGIAGIPLVAALLALLFWGFDGLARRHAPLLVLPALMPFLFSLCNNSLFTSLLSGGGLVLGLLFAVLPE